MKVRISLPKEAIEFLDSYVLSRGLRSRSAALRQAVRLLRSLELTHAYEAAWAEWANSDEARLWEPTAADVVTT